MDFKEKIKVYLVVAWALATAKTKEERNEILKLLSDFESKNDKGDE